MVRLKGSTLIEVVISLIILTISFSIGMMVIETILNTNKSALKYSANLELVAIAQQTLDNYHFLDETIEQTEYWIEKKITPYEQTKHLYILSLKAFDQKGELIVTRKDILYVPN